MFILISSVFWSWEMMHVQVPLSWNSTVGTWRTFPVLILFLGCLNFTEGLLPGGDSKVRVRLCPCSTPVPGLAVTVEGANHMCHTHTILKEKGRGEETKNVSPLSPVPTSHFLPAPCCPHPAQGGTSLSILPLSPSHPLPHLHLLPSLSPSFLWLLPFLFFPFLGLLPSLALTKGLRRI